MSIFSRFRKRSKPGRPEWSYPDTLAVVQLEHSERLIRAHRLDVCVGNVCSIHNRTDHPMRAFRQHWRGDRQIMERICPHGCGHPDPDDYRIRTGEDDGTHGCCGCCRPGGVLPEIDTAEAEFDHMWKEASS